MPDGVINGVAKEVTLFQRHIHDLTRCRAQDAPHERKHLAVRLWRHVNTPSLAADIQRAAGVTRARHGVPEDCGPQLESTAFLPLVTRPQLHSCRGDVPDI